MWTNEVIMMIVRGIGETVYMTVVSTLLGYIFGLPIGIAAAPFIGRMVESSLKEVDGGVIEAARSMGASNFTIITEVMLVEVILLIVLVQIFQTIGMRIAAKLDRRR